MFIENIKFTLNIMINEYIIEYFVIMFWDPAKGETKQKYANKERFFNIDHAINNIEKHFEFKNKILI